MLDAMREDLAQAYANKVTHMSLHTGDPGTTGDNEVSGGAPAYARRAVVWTFGGVDGYVEGATASDFDVPAGTDITHVGLWNGSTLSDVVEYTQSFSAQGTLGFSSIWVEVNP